MNGYLIALKAELYVSVRSFSSKLLVLAPSLLITIQLLLSKLSQAGNQARQGLQGNNSIDDISANNAYGYFVDSVTTGLTLLTLILVGYAAWSFAYDKDTGLIRHLVIRRVSRRALVLAKLTHLHMLALIAIVLLLTSASLTAGWLWEFGPVTEDGFELISVAEIHVEILLGLQLALIPLPAAIAFGVLVSVSTQSTTQAISVALGITLALDIFKAVLGNASYYLYATFQPSLLDQSYLGDVSRIVRGYSDILIDDAVLQLNYWVPLPEAFILVAAALIIVQQRRL